MRPLTSFLLALAVGAGAGPWAGAAEPGGGWWQFLCGSTSRQCPCCPDDYHPKTLPPNPCLVPSGGPNDYCAKTQPVTYPYSYCGVDDYCRKTCPIVLRPCYPPWYTCGAPHTSPCSVQKE
jgi:hypothetical protein